MTDTRTNDPAWKWDPNAAGKGRGDFVLKMPWYRRLYWFLQNKVHKVQGMVKADQHNRAYWKVMSQRKLAAPDFKFNHMSNKVDGLPPEEGAFTLPVGTAFQLHTDGKVYLTTAPLTVWVEERGNTNYDNMRRASLPTKEQAWIKGPWNDSTNRKVWDF